MVSRYDMECRRYAAEVREALRQEQLHDAYRSGRVSIRFSSSGEVEYLGSEAERLHSHYRNYRNR